jgi:hypothetical protein
MARYGRLWITLAIDEGTYRRVECDPYESLFEAPEAEPSP